LNAAELLDDDLHLFLDDSEIYAREGVGRRVNALRKEPEPVLVGEHAWEGSHVAWATVLHDAADDLYKMWYVALPPLQPPFSSVVCYATSSDGINWTKPELDVVKMPDGARTNIVVLGGEGTTSHLQVATPELSDPDYPALGLEAGTSHLQAFADLGSASRFQAIVYQSRRRPDAERLYGSFLALSDDGIHWSVSDQPALAHQGDRTHVVFDPRRNVFMLTTRHRNLGLQGRAGVSGWIRDVDLWESADLRDWAHRGRALWRDEDDPADFEYYGLMPLAYGRGYLGFIEAYHTDVETLDMQLAWSDDGRGWQRRANREAILPLGGDGAWDTNWVMVTTNPPEVVGERLRFWYVGSGTHHGSKAQHRRAIGVATIRRDGFVSMEGSMHGGSLTTAALDAREPHRLHLNLRADTGVAAVEVLDVRGQVLEGFAAEDCRLSAVDAVDAEVSWRGGDTVPSQPDGAVLLRFTLQRASLYSYRWVSVA
jgi:hypothetical protein